MELKYTKHFLNKLEDVFSESEYILRYEKGNFKSGYCLLHRDQVVVINKYYSLEGKINCLVELLRSLPIAAEQLSEKNQKLISDLKNSESKA